MHPTRESRKPKPESADRVKITPGTLQDGVVVASDKDGLSCAVKLTRYGIVLEGCLVGRAITSALLGYNLNYQPPRGTKVKVAIGQPPVIVTMLDSHVGDTKGARGCYSVTGTDKKAVKDTKTFKAKGNYNFNSHATPRDLLEGEFQISNMLGVALSMLTTMAKLSAGDRAKVEVFLLNDMVRIVSQTYRHFSAVGQQQIYDDGRLNSRLDASSYVHEALGLVKPKDQRVPVEQNVADLKGLDKVMETGRWRYSHFLGFMGDFIHLFVTDPVDTVAKIAADALPRSGNAHLHIGAGGEVLVQSISEICFERVVRIPVPIELKRPEDPSGIKQEDYDALDKKFLKLWEIDASNPSKMVFQIREYARWLSTYHSLARFHQQEGADWKVPKESELTEAENLQPDWAAREDDKDEVNKGALRYKDTYACIRIMRDGSIVNLNGEGGAMCLAGKNGYMSVPANLYLEAGGDMHFTAGQSMYFLARRSMELVAVAGGLKMKARTWLQGLCERGTVWLKSDAVAPTYPGYVAPAATDNQMSGEQDPMPEFVGHGIFLDSPKSSVAAIGAGATLASVKKGNDDGSESDADVFVQADKASVRGIAGGDVELRIRKRFVVVAGGDFILKARKALWELTGNIFDINQLVTFRGAVLNIMRVKAGSISALFNFTGPKMGPIIPPEPESNLPLRYHLNHIGLLPEGTALNSFKVQTWGKNADGGADTAEVADIAARNAITGAPVVINPPPRQGIWDFESPAVYQWAENPFHESLTQQRIRTDPDLWDSYGDWSWNAQNKLIPALHNGSHAPVVGSGAQHLVHAVAGKALHKPSGSSIDDLAVQTPLVPVNITFKFLKKNTI